MFRVMPHVEDITLTLNNIRKKLKKNGSCLSVLETGYSHSLL